MHEPVEYVLKETESRDDLVALLEGRVFHVTLREHWPSIVAHGAIKANEDGVLPGAFGSRTNGFFRKRGCVSVFDWREPPTEKILSFRHRCWPLQPAEVGGSGIALLLLHPRIESRLIPWTKWKEEEDLEGVRSQMVVPYSEAGHPGPIPLADVDRVLFFRLVEDPTSTSLAARMRRKRLEKKRLENGGK